MKNEAETLADIANYLLEKWSENLSQVVINGWEPPGGWIFSEKLLEPGDLQEKEK